MIKKSCKNCKYLYIPMKDAESLIRTKIQLIDELFRALHSANSERKGLIKKIEDLEEELRKLKDI